MHDEYSEKLLQSSMQIVANDEYLGLDQCTPVPLFEVWPHRFNALRHKYLPTIM